MSIRQRFCFLFQHNGASVEVFAADKGNVQQYSPSGWSGKTTLRVGQRTGNRHQACFTLPSADVRQSHRFGGSRPAHNRKASKSGRKENTKGHKTNHTITFSNVVQ